LDLFQPVRQTFIHQLDQNIPLRGGGFNIDVVKPIRKFVPERLNPEDKLFSRGEWCYDTPGTVVTDVPGIQITDFSFVPFSSVYHFFSRPVHSV
jgi:hypothetical protein